MIGFSAVWAFHLVFVMSGFTVSWFFPIMGLVIVSMIFYMGFKALTQPEIFATEEERQTVPKYARTALVPEKADTRIVPHKTIEYRMSDGREVKVEFAERAGGILVMETCDAETENPPELQRTGWQANLDNFSRHVEVKG